uniref:Uncharacterized protein n=1 Tax=Branchiostoma floridae TaxID=7739 RepID=C3Y3R2_BRAFL|eukprot:XP_002608928.1 hypothetical protein BRAFLDRAFT_85507 [Branchiostoma floridae]
MYLFTRGHATVWFRAPGRGRECARGRNRQGVARAFCLACVWSREGSDAGADQVIDRGFGRSVIRCLVLAVIWTSRPRGTCFSHPRGTTGSVPSSDRVSEAESLVDLYAPLVRTRSAAITHWCVARLSPSDRTPVTSPYPQPPVYLRGEGVTPVGHTLDVHCRKIQDRTAESQTTTTKGHTSTN